MFKISLIRAKPDEDIFVIKASFCHAKNVLEVEQTRKLIPWVSKDISKDCGLDEGNGAVKGQYQNWVQKML